MTQPNGSGAGNAPDTRLRRIAENAVDDPEVLSEIVGSAVLAHVGVVLDGLPYVLPVACAPWPAGITGRTDRTTGGGEPERVGTAADAREAPGLLMHGSTGSRLFRALAAGTPACATITHLDGLVLARSAFHSSMTYRSAMIMGRCEVIVGSAKDQALNTLTDHLLPGRRASLRATTGKENAATMVLGLRTQAWSVKVGVDGPDDPAEDLVDSAHVWAGVVPIRTAWGSPQPDEVSKGLEVPPYIGTWPSPGAIS